MRFGVDQAQIRFTAFIQPRSLGLTKTLKELKFPQERNTGDQGIQDARASMPEPDAVESSTPCLNHHTGSVLTAHRSQEIQMTHITNLVLMAALAIALPTLGEAAEAAKSTKPPTVMLVHGAWSDGSSWNEVIARLQAQGLRVVSVQNPLTSLGDDVAAVNRALARESGPVVLVGHSWGGTVITEAGGSDKVVALVYVAAFAPDRGQSTSDVQANLPPPGYAGLLAPDSAGFLWFPQEALPQWFAQDLPAHRAMVLASAQNPIRASAFGDKVSEAAWRIKPSWYLVTEQDRMIYPDLQREMAARIKARTRSISASHVPFLSNPKATTELILDAVQAARAP
jgi:pimeloyl-ACP methyl ester carboxylesterase